MSALLLTLFSFVLILFHGKALPCGGFFSKYENRDDYYEDYYLRRVPKLRTEKVEERFVNPLSWFPADELKKENNNWHKNNRRGCYFVNLQLEGTTTPNEMSSNEKCVANLTGKVKNKLQKIKEFAAYHRINANWTKIKEKSCISFLKVKNYMKKKKIKEVLKNVTHPLRYRGPFKNCSKELPSAFQNDEYKYLGPCVRIHAKSSMDIIQTSSSTPFPFIFQDTHFSIPRKIKVIIDLKNSESSNEGNEKALKTERNVKEKYIPSIDADATNTTNVLEAAGEMASDLAGRVTSLWHCVLGSHRVPDTRDVNFYLYTRRNIILPELLKVDYDLISRKKRANPEHKDVDCVDLPPENIPEFERVSDENRKIIKSNFLNIRAPTKILIHGYTGSYKDSRMAKIKDAYLSSGRYNVIQVDWEMLAAPPCYIRVTHHSKFVGETIAKFLDGLHLVGLNMSLVHLVGFSLGAQVAGFAGNNATITPVCRITGLDPALPLFLHTQPSGHLDRLDAKFVDVIHTCGGILAMLDPLGHVDFYPNGGTKQPGCEFSNLKCSHSRAPQYFAESVVSQKKFTGQLCRSWEEYIAGDCDNNTDISFMGEPCSRKGIESVFTEFECPIKMAPKYLEGEGMCGRSVFGKYYLLTKSKEPFVL